MTVAVTYISDTLYAGRVGWVKEKNLDLDWSSIEETILNKRHFYVENNINNINIDNTALEEQKV